MPTAGPRPAIWLGAVRTGATPLEVRPPFVAGLPAAPREAAPDVVLVDVGRAPEVAAGAVTGPVDVVDLEIDLRDGDTVADAGAAGAGVSPAPEALPHRDRGGTVWDTGSRAGTPATPAGPPAGDWTPVEPPDLDLVRRVLDGLRRL
jgi:hypothetical protein